MTHLQAKIKIKKGKSTTNITIIRKGERSDEKLNWLERELTKKIWYSFKKNYYGNKRNKVLKINTIQPIIWMMNYRGVLTQPTITDSKLTIEILEQGAKYVQS